MELALANVIDGVVANVIGVADGVTAESIGLEGLWIQVEDGAVGVGFSYNSDTGEFSRPVVEDQEVPE